MKEEKVCKTFLIIYTVYWRDGRLGHGTKTFPHMFEINWPFNLSGDVF